jgi:hypothetical protein
VATSRARVRVGAQGPPLAALVALWLIPLALACGSRAPGPAFEVAPLPPPNRARLYVYRADERTSLASVRVTVDGLDVGRFQALEYESLELPAGRHHVRAGMRGFAWLAWGWSDYHVELAPGETAYLMLSIRLAEQSPAPAGRESEIAGRPDGGTVSENVFIVPRSASEALADLQKTTRLPDDA